MLILDTDHLTALDRQGRSGQLHARLGVAPERVCTTIVSVAEQMRGLQALLSKARSAGQISMAYGRIDRWIKDVGTFDILPWSDEATAIAGELAQSKIRVGTMDLRIAAIVLANGATLLSRNLRNFERVPDLRVENWLD